MMLSDVCLSVAYTGPKSRTERSRKTKIGTEVAHVTRDSDTVKRSKVKVTRLLYSPPCWRVMHLQRWAWERDGRETLLLRCRLLGRARRGAHGGGEGRGHIVAAARLQLVHLGFSAAIRTQVYAYGRNVGRRMVVARSNCSRMGVKSKTNRSCNYRLKVHEGAVVKRYI